MIIPWRSLDAEVLEALITEYVLREGTDYGEVEVPLSTKVAQVKQQLIENKIVLLWSEVHETVNIISRDKIKYVDEQNIE